MPAVLDRRVACLFNAQPCHPPLSGYPSVRPGYHRKMPKDRDQMTPDEPEDAEKLERERGQGTGGTGRDVLSNERSAPGAASAS